VAETEEEPATTGGEEVVWHYQLGGRELGPVSWAEIEELLADTAGEEDLLVRTWADEAWRPAADLVQGVPRAKPASRPAPGPSAPAVRRPIGVAIVAVLFGFPAGFWVLGVAVVVIAFGAAGSADLPIGPDLIGLGIIGGLSLVSLGLLKAAVCLYKGFNWARIVFMVLLGLLALGGVYLLLVFVESPGPPAAGIALCVVLILILNARGARRYCSR